MKESRQRLRYTLPLIGAVVGLSALQHTDAKGGMPIPATEQTSRTQDLSAVAVLDNKCTFKIASVGF